MSTARQLAEYAHKRDFDKSREPPPKLGAGNRRRFVVQRHEASRLHFDFRLEVDKTLRSWAVPKGVPYTHGEKHLAVQVEDHPVSYFDFEGTIPRGEYGGGTVMVWDYGTFESLSGDPAEALEAGKLHFVLRGDKLAGEWILVRTRGKASRQWLLIRGGDDMKSPGVRKATTSALTGRTMQQIEATRPARDASMHRASPKRIGAADHADHGRLPRFVEPMKARLVAAPPAGDWHYEVKLDGYRALALLGERRSMLLSRNQKDFAERFPEIAAALDELPARDSIFDGEVVALDAHGRSSFSLLKNSENNDRPLLYYVFDVLRFEGRDVTRLPIEKRRALLESVPLETCGGVVRLSQVFDAPLERLMGEARRLGLEGLIGKRKGSHYEAGARSGAWIKLKIGNEQEFVVGGYSDPQGSRAHFGALLLGVYEDGGLRYAGKVGTGFDERTLTSLGRALAARARKTTPFAALDLSPAERRRAHWVTPDLVCQVRFTEWTPDHHLRHPVFIGLREDKDASSVVREPSTPLRPARRRKKET